MGVYVEPISGKVQVFPDGQLSQSGSAEVASLDNLAPGGVEKIADASYTSFTLTAAGKALLDDADAAAQRTTLGLAIGTDVVAQSHVGSGGSSHATLAGATSGTAGTAGFVPAPQAGDQNKFMRGDATWQTISGGGDLLAANNLSDLANASTARANLGLVIGTDVAAQSHNHDAAYQPLDSDLTALAGLTGTGLLERTGAGSAGTVTVTSAGKALLDDADAAAQRTTLGLAIGSDVAAQSHVGSGGSSHATLVGATSGAAGTAGFVPAPQAGDQSKFMRGDATWQTIGGGGDLLAANNLSDLANVSTARANLGLVIGTDVAAQSHNHDAAYQPLDSDLTALAGLTGTGLLERTGAGSAGTVAVTTAGKALLDDADTAAQRTTLGLVIGTDVAAQSHVGAGGSSHAAFVGDTGSGGAAGFVPAPSTGDADRFLKGNGTWATVAGGGSAITVKDEGSNLTTALASLDFVGDGVTATTSGNNVTVTIPASSGLTLAQTLRLSFLMG